jgi:alpha-beta hydrolase superfamily lysophospholipase
VEEDILGKPYTRRTIDLGRDDEGPVVATLVSRRCDAGADRAVLYVHGYADYFFQHHVADWYVDHGFDFYALDLRKYGRSLLPHQTPNFTRSVSEYFPELTEAARIIRTEDGHGRLLLNGHSTGALVSALWAHEVRAAGLVDAVFLNSPFFEFNLPGTLRAVVGPVYAAVARSAPYAKLPGSISLAYSHSIHADHHGEWSYDETWKPARGFPVRAGWHRAVRAGHARVRRGLDITVPVLVACATRSLMSITWKEAAMDADSVLNVKHMVRYASRLGPDVTLVRIDGGLHDLTLSRPAARTRLFAELDRWLTANLPA